MTLIYKILSGLYLGNHKVQEVNILVGTLIRGCMCVTSWCDLDLTIELVILIMSFKILSGLFLRFHHV